MSLRLVLDDPSRGRVFTDRDIRGRQVRSGDRREPVQIEPHGDTRLFLAAAAQVGLESSCAVSLAVERLLTLAALRGAGVDTEAARTHLNAEADCVRVAQAKNRQDATYLRRLATGRTTATPTFQENAVTVAIPGRLVDRAHELPMPWQLRARDVPEMIRWEAAAIARGQTMGEWAALTMLAAVSVAESP